MNVWVMLPILVALASVRCHAQRPEFEVAAVKLAHPQGDRIGIDLGTIRNERLTLTNATLSDWLKFAYGLVSDEQLSGPDWMKSRAFMYDVVAQAPPGTPREQQLVMLQDLLIDRMKLMFHHEKRETSFLALVPGKNGPRITEVTDDSHAANPPAWPGHIASPHLAMATLALLLSRFQRATVIDMTGLKGVYVVKLEWTPDDPHAVAPELLTDSPSLFTSLQEQLGLKLERRKGPIDVLVIDSVERTPVEN